MEIYLFMLFFCSHYMMLVSFPSPKRQLVLIALKVSITQTKWHPQQTNESCFLLLSSLLPACNAFDCIQNYLSNELLTYYGNIPFSSYPFQFVISIWACPYAGYPGFASTHPLSKPIRFRKTLSFTTHSFPKLKYFLLTSVSDNGKREWVRVGIQCSPTMYLIRHAIANIK